MLEPGGGKVLERSLVKTAEKTMPLLVMFAIIQVVFTGCLFTLNGSIGVNEFSYLMPSRWAVAAADSSGVKSAVAWLATR